MCSLTLDKREGARIFLAQRQPEDVKNPDVMIVTTPEEEALAYSDPRFASVKAVVNKRVFIIPQGAHNWGNRTIEQPLTVL
jgi:ABC-type Fe3+-hydroxamate transport system substrate-binding protein